MGNFWSQSFFLPKPTLTAETCPDQTGRIFIVTGGYAGVGFELVKILVERNATVYIAGRDDTKASRAVAAVKEAHPRTAGRVEFLKLDLADLSTIKPAVEKFLSQETKLDVLVNNAGVMFPPKGSLSKQSHDLQVGTNCLGHYLLYKLLEPTLEKTASSSPTASVRVTWAGSLGVEVLSPKSGGMKLDAEGCPEDLGPQQNYAQTKVGNIFFARHLARTGSKIIHVSFNPGNLKTELQRHAPKIGSLILDITLLFPAIYGAYTELWAAVSPEITPEKNGAYVWPWGRTGGMRADIEVAAKSVQEGGSGLAEKFVGWCEREVQPFT